MGAARPDLDLGFLLNVIINCCRLLYAAHDHGWGVPGSRLSLPGSDRALARRGWLNPVAVTVFGGVDPPGRGKGPQRDLRNWQAIHVWATDTLGTVARMGQDRSTAGQ